MKLPLWARLVLGILGLLILAFTLPAYFNPSANPALANLSPENAGLGSVGGAFLGRQLTLALIGLFGAWNARPMAAGLGAFAFAGFNLHDAVMLSMNGGSSTGAIVGTVFGIAALAVLWAAIRTNKQNDSNQT